MTSRFHLLAAAALVAVSASVGAQNTAPPVPDEASSKAEEAATEDEAIQAQPATPPVQTPTEATPPAPAAPPVQGPTDPAPPAQATPQAQPPAQTAPPAAQTTPPAPPAAQTPATPQPQALPAPAAPAGPVTAATAADLRVGATVYDPQGGTVGTVESVDAQGVVVSTGTARALLAPTTFAKNALGLVISVTRADLEARVAAQSPPPTPTPSTAPSDTPAVSESETEPPDPPN